ncbi:MAG: DUF192 domain-containing protein [Candidatus Woesearchaeota archaeon]
MKGYAAVIGLSILCFLAASCSDAGKDYLQDEKKEGTWESRQESIKEGHVRITSGNTSTIITIETAHSTDDIKHGLMFREALPPDHGMLFIYDREARRSFWMKNMEFPIDIMFISGNGTITGIRKDVPPCVKTPCPSYTSEGKVMYVLEANAGYAERKNISAGDRAEINI